MIRGSITAGRPGSCRSRARRECMTLRLNALARFGLRRASLVVVVLAAAAVSGCRQDMHDAPRIEAYEANSFFADGRGSRTPPTGTVARGWLRQDEALY